ncbi:MAG: methionine biosynthesis protein MetW, partial [Candidatus Omnitrophota bacterium]
MDETNGVVRPDHKLILELVPEGSSVLDLGCGEGDLLELLVKEKNVKARGIEIDEQAIYKCVAKGLSVFHGDIDSGLSEYRDGSFDLVILNQSLQQIRHLDLVLQDALRVGKKVIVGFPNFAYFRARLRLGLKGKVPVTKSLPYNWYDTPNLHFFSIADFLDYCREKGIRVE